MRQVLVPIDPANPGRTRSAVAEVVALYRAEPVGVQLLRVQPRLNGHVAMFFGEGELRQLQLQAGAEDLQYARGLLDAAGVPCTASVRVGRSAESIAAAARELGCDRIIFGSEGAGLASRVFGLLAQQVRQLLGTGGVQVIGS